MQYATRLIHERTLGLLNLPTGNQSTTGEFLAWFVQSASSFGQSVSNVNPRGIHLTATSNLYGTPIGGAWEEYSVATTGLNLTLPRHVVFASNTPKHASIPPSLNNGYLNSRIDLRRRKRAFGTQVAGSVDQPIISLHLRDDVMFQPRNVDPGVLVSQLHEATKRHQEIERENIARKLRKARKKKKKESNVKGI
ncbi:hypothetical protein FRC07_008795 [Ceratobasidium sp. 392]|nr:hypothetical protein FRC07_008795 [Ceratobasidium sp. 392]